MSCYISASSQTIHAECRGCNASAVATRPEHHHYQVSKRSASDRDRAWVAVAGLTLLECPSRDDTVGQVALMRVCDRTLALGDSLP